MTAVNMPGFTAEASLAKTGERYRMFVTRNAEFAASVVQPARFPCSSCEDICAGDIIGQCLPWCFCACRGGTHCPLPS